MNGVPAPSFRAWDFTTEKDGFGRVFFLAREDGQQRIRQQFSSSTHKFGGPLEQAVTIWKSFMEERHGG